MKTWNFVPSNYKDFDVRTNAFSSMKGTKLNAVKWAKYLLVWNTSADHCIFTREGGRKIYEVRRAELDNVSRFYQP